MSLWLKDGDVDGDDVAGTSFGTVPLNRDGDTNETRYDETENEAGAAAADSPQAELRCADGAAAAGGGGDAACGREACCEVCDALADGEAAGAATEGVAGEAEGAEATGAGAADASGSMPVGAGLCGAGSGAAGGGDEPSGASEAGDGCTAGGAAEAAAAAGSVAVADGEAVTQAACGMDTRLEAASAFLVGAESVREAILELCFAAIREGVATASLPRLMMEAMWALLLPAKAPSVSDEQMKAAMRQVCDVAFEQVAASLREIELEDVA